MSKHEENENYKKLDSSIGESDNPISWQLTNRQECDLELLLNGSFSPLDYYMGKKEYDLVLQSMRLLDGSLWPIPIALDVDENLVNKLGLSTKITLKNKEGFPLAILSVEEVWKPDFNKEAIYLYDTSDIYHPGVNFLYNRSNPFYVGGTLEKIKTPVHYDYKHYRHSPQKLKRIFKDIGWDRIVAFQTRNPLHKAHIEMTMRAMDDLNSNLQFNN